MTPREIAEELNRFWSGVVPAHAIESALTDYGRQCAEAERKECWEIARSWQPPQETGWKHGIGINQACNGIARAIRDRE